MIFPAMRAMGLCQRAHGKRFRSRVFRRSRQRTSSIPISARTAAFTSFPSGISALTLRGTAAQLRKSKDLIREFETDPNAACRVSPADVMRRGGVRTSSDGPLPRAWSRPSRRTNPNRPEEALGTRRGRPDARREPTFSRVAESKLAMATGSPFLNPFAPMIIRRASQRIAAVAVFAATSAAVAANAFVSESARGPPAALRRRRHRRQLSHDAREPHDDVSTSTEN